MIHTQLMSLGGLGTGLDDIHDTQNGINNSEEIITLIIIIVLFPGLPHFLFFGLR